MPTLKPEDEGGHLGINVVKELVPRISCYQKVVTILVFKIQTQSIELELKVLTLTKTNKKKIVELQFHRKFHFYQLSPKKNAHLNSKGSCLHTHG